MAITPIGTKASESGVKLPLDNPAILDALRKGNIQDVHKLLGDFGLTIEDFEQFANNQHAKYVSVVQAEPLYESFASIPPPYVDDIMEQNPSFKLTTPDSVEATGYIIDTIDHYLREFNQQSGGSSGQGAGKGASPGKSMVKGAAKGAGKGSGKGAGAPDLSNVDPHIQNVQDIHQTALDAEMEFIMNAELAKAESNFERDWQELLRKLRMGEIDPEAAICAIATLQSQRIGAQTTREMKKIYQANQNSTRATQAMQSLDPTSPNYSGKLMEAQNIMKMDTQNIQFSTNNINSLTNGAQTYLNASKSMLDGIHSTKLKLVEALATR